MFPRVYQSNNHVSPSFVPSLFFFFLLPPPSDIKRGVASMKRDCAIDTLSAALDNVDIVAEAAFGPLMERQVGSAYVHHMDSTPMGWF